MLLTSVRAAVARAVGENPHIQLIAPVRDRPEFARILASADMMVHGAPAETFGIACAEARASGLPLIVPDAGAAYDQLEPGIGMAFKSLDAASLASTIADAIPGLSAMRANAVAAADAGGGAAAAVSSAEGPRRKALIRLRYLGGSCL